ncbi:hypothetical protein RHGRI_006267 [Rhododendron griersonianum]|uniref:Uncharacterized protein n=1 Tax=Rhododendron griersonianum TaxID=479676 RepID=A0AAV6KSG0_9ERIC|nr:hypothetical protein RHGRI_006267 [Rhododendron griersonianum]
MDYKEQRRIFTAYLQSSHWQRENPRIVFWEWIIEQFPSCFLGMNLFIDRITQDNHNGHGLWRTKKNFPCLFAIISLALRKSKDCLLPRRLTILLMKSHS